MEFSQWNDVGLVMSYMCMVSYGSLFMVRETLDEIQPVLLYTKNEEKTKSIVY